MRLREDCAALDADERLSNPAAAKQRLPETSAALEQVRGGPAAPL